MNHTWVRINEIGRKVVKDMVFRKVRVRRIGKTISLFCYIVFLVMSLKVSEFFNGNIVSKYNKSTNNEFEIFDELRDRNMTISIDISIKVTHYFLSTFSFIILYFILV